MQCLTIQEKRQQSDYRYDKLVGEAELTSEIMRLETIFTSVNQLAIL